LRIACTTLGMSAFAIILHFELWLVLPTPQRTPNTNE
jgi:hypothetical protein